MREGAVLWTVGCSAASLTLQRDATSPPLLPPHHTHTSSNNQKCLQTLPTVLWGTASPALTSTLLKVTASYLSLGKGSEACLAAAESFCQRGRDLQHNHGLSGGRIVNQQIHIHCRTFYKYIQDRGKAVFKSSQKQKKKKRPFKKSSLNLEITVTQYFALYPCSFFIYTYYV